MTRGLRLALGVSISGASIWFVFRGFDFDILKTSLQKAHFIWILPAAGLYLLNQYLRTERWKNFLSPLKTISAKGLFPVLCLGFFMNTVLPARAGEFIRAYVAHKKFDINPASALGSVVAERVTDFFGLFIIVLFSTKILPLDKVPLFKIISIFAVGISGISLLFFISKKIGKGSTSVFQEKVKTILTNLTQGFSIIKEPRKILLILALSSIIWINEVIFILIVSNFISFPVRFFQSCAVIVGLSLGVMIPAAPGFIGTFEFFGKQMLEFLGFPSDSSLNFILVLHFLQILFVSLVGLMSLFLLRNYYSFSKKERNATISI